MQISLRKTSNQFRKIAAGKPQSGGSAIPNVPRLPAGWKPQPSGLTRDETRELVLEMIG